MAQTGNLDATSSSMCSRREKNRKGQSPLPLFPPFSQRGITFIMVRNFERGRSWVQVESWEQNSFQPLTVQNEQIKSAFPGLRASFTWGPNRMPPGGRGREVGAGLYGSTHFLCITQIQLPKRKCQMLLFQSNNKTSKRNTGTLSSPNMLQTAKECQQMYSHFTLKSKEND